VRNVWGQTECQNLKNALSKEWLETNGLGGFASSTIIGANTRRQHGLLVVALQPPGDRHVLLAKLEEKIEADGHEAHLSTNLYPGTIYPHGFNIQQEFRLRPWPTFRYATSEFDLEKTVTMIHGENTVVVGYRNLKARGPVTLWVRPLLAFRHYGALGRRDDTVTMALERGNGVVSVQPRPGLPRLYFHIGPATVTAVGDWYYNLSYPTEEGWQAGYQEDVFAPLELAFAIAAGQTAYLVATTEPKTAVKPEELLARERDRRLRDEREADPDRRALLVASGAFLARRGEDGLTVLAGYPWSTDWGRDAMIALPGLTLTAGRHDAARRILLTYAQYCNQGLIPHVFRERDARPEYHEADVSLWFIVAAWRYWKATGDKATLQQLLPVCAEILKHYQAGTRAGIHTDADGLIHAGAPGLPVTWMNANIDGYLPTPRHGKAVEINALWFNALMMMAEFEAKIAQNIPAATVLRKRADWVAASFSKVFWNREAGCLYDTVHGTARDASIRPNQLLAVSLPFSPLNREQQQAVFDVVTKQLLTPYGLRSLARDHERYSGRYTGSRLQRGAAVHQGLIWPWLIGPYCDAYARLHGTGKAQRQEIERLLRPLLDHLADAGLGSLPEIFEDDPSYRQAGCYAQAWSVAEVLRVYDTYL